MQLKTYELDRERIEIVNLGDVHYGNINCDTDLLYNNISYIIENPNVYWVSTGDIFEVAIRGSKVADVHESMSLRQEMDILGEMLQPIAHKCFGIVGSNHSDRIERETSLNIDEMFCRLYNIPYLGVTGRFRVKLGGVGYYICMHHGVGGGRKKGTGIDKATELAYMHPGYDIYLEGHTHKPNWTFESFRELDRKHLSEIERVSYFATTGSYLKYEGGYAEKKKLHPAVLGSSVIKLRAGNSWSNKYVGFEFLQGG